MDEDSGNGKLRTPMMERAEEPSRINFCNDVNYAFMGEVGVRDIVECENHARDELSDEKKKDNATGEIPAFVFVRRDEF